MQFFSKRSPASLDFDSFANRVSKVIGVEALQSLNDIEAQVQAKYAEATPICSFRQCH